MRKNQGGLKMKNKIFCCLASACLICSLFLSGCSEIARPDESDQKNIDKRIEVVYGHISSYHEIIVDKKTGVMYIAIAEGGICVMVDENGKPLKYNRK